MSWTYSLCASKIKIGEGTGVEISIVNFNLNPDGKSNEDNPNERIQTDTMEGRSSENRFKVFFK